MINYNKLGQKVQTTGGIEKVNLTDPRFVTPYGLSSNTFTLTINLHAGTFDYTIVKKDETVSSMDTPKYSFDATPASNPSTIPVN